MTVIESGAPMFLPLDYRGLMKYAPDMVPPYKLDIISLDGPNGTGKTSALRSAVHLFHTMQSMTSPKDRPIAPKVIVAEPPSIKITEDLPDTWRSIAKEWKGTHLSEKDLRNNPLLQATMFLWGRRMVEKQAFFDFPFKDDSGTWQFTDSSVLVDASQRCFTPDQLEQCGQAILIKDRGTASTLRYQGQNPKGGEKVLSLVSTLYRQRFLKPERLTILVMPVSVGTLRPDGHGREIDRYDEQGNVDSYRRVKRFQGTFTDQVFEITNDPTGASYNISTTSLTIATLMFLASQPERIPIGTENVVDCKWDAALRRLTDVGIPGCESFSQMVHEDMGRQRKIISGEVTIREIDLHRLGATIVPQIKML